MEGRPGHNGGQIDFAQIFANAQQSLQSNHISSQQEIAQQQPRRLADMHTARAVETTKALRTFEAQQEGVALKRMSTFITTNLSAIRRLSRLPAAYDYTEIMAAYGKTATDSPLSASSVTSQSQAQAPSATLTSSGSSIPRSGEVAHSPAPQSARMSSDQSSLEKTSPFNYHQTPLPEVPNSNHELGSPQDSTTVETSPRSTFSNSPAALNAAAVQLTRRQPPRSNTPLPASPRASLALSSSSIRRKLGTEGPAPPLPGVPNLAGNLSN